MPPPSRSLGGPESLCQRHALPAGGASWRVFKSGLFRRCVLVGDIGTWSGECTAGFCIKHSPSHRCLTSCHLQTEECLLVFLPSHILTSGAPCMFKLVATSTTIRQSVGSHGVHKLLRTILIHGLVHCRPVVPLDCLMRFICNRHPYGAMTSSRTSFPGGPPLTVHRAPGHDFLAQTDARSSTPAGITFSCVRANQVC